MVLIFTLTAALALTSYVSPTPKPATKTTNQPILVPPHDIPADVLAEREKQIQSKYLEYTHKFSKRSPRNYLRKRDDQEWDETNEKKEVPVSYLQEGITDMCNTLDNIGRLGGARLTGVTPSRPEPSEFFDEWQFYDTSDPTSGMVNYFGGVKDGEIKIFTERIEYREHTTRAHFPYTTRENEPRSVGWWFQKPIPQGFNWNDCFDNYWAIINACERVGQRWWGSTGGRNNVTNNDFRDFKWVVSCIHVNKPK
ncbi:hypothetical protein H072_11036 [Dactylellina haptotyla CBS 200.50]|uniref:Uncharacterized protein n=1 Tax=Dactylellina haptotyla (strain CBS 200.50) TaxID=1284197 RepID=S8A2X1_DACHA|nr:hypothetical protein H072_11036 [Dactylellina haptotyla CBS 200.50]